MPLPCFKAYDIRGRVPDELNPALARRIGMGMARLLGNGPVVLGRDVRLTSLELQQALEDGFRHAGRETVDTSGIWYRKGGRPYHREGDDGHD